MLHALQQQCQSFQSLVHVTTTTFGKFNSFSGNFGCSLAFGWCNLVPVAFSCSISSALSHFGLPRLAISSHYLFTFALLESFVYHIPLSWLFLCFLCCGTVYLELNC